MRYIFIDEAGTSEHEPVTVVVGIVANADDHVMAAEALVSEILGAVPDKFRKDFVFHAMQVYGDKKYQEGWSLTDRLILLKAMMSVPRRIGMWISVSAQWRDLLTRDPSYGTTLKGLLPWQVQHLAAFGLCIAVADRNIRNHGGPREVATVVAEDCVEMRKFLKTVPTSLRKKPLYLEPDLVRETVSDKEAGYITQSGDIRVSRTRNSVHFVEKSDDPLVQVSDACAYGIRRFFANEKFGDEFVQAIYGRKDALRNFASPGGAECIRFS